MKENPAEEFDSAMDSACALVSYTLLESFLLVLQVRNDMDKAGFRPTPSIWGSLIVVCGQGGLIEQAFSMWKDMTASGTQPTVSCLNALMNAASEAFQGDRGLQVFRQAQAMGELFSQSAPYSLSQPLRP